MSRKSTTRLVLAALLVLYGAASANEAALPFSSSTTRAALQAPSKQESSRSDGRAVPLGAHFQEDKDKGLLVKTWINDTGPYNFAIDTGAGELIISHRVADIAGVVATGQDLTITGLNGASFAVGKEAVINHVAVGTSTNVLASGGKAIVGDIMPPGVDGILDPTEAYWPFGYTIDMQHGYIWAFDPRTSPLRDGTEAHGGTIVSWVSMPGTHRPFVVLDNGKRALVDTGSALGLAIPENAAALFNARRGGQRPARQINDLGRGSITVQEIDPLSVRLGSLVLRGVPSEVLSGVASDSPILLGREVLRPFQVTFDPLSRLIQFAR